MSLTTALIYKSKSFMGHGFGRRATKLGKYLAGLYFDLVLRTYRTEGMTFLIPVDQTTREMRGKFAVDTYELPERTLVKRHLSPQSAVLEMGGCIGVVSCTINKLLQNPTRHVVLEANPHLIPILTANRNNNNCAFAIHNTVISNHPMVKISLDRTMDSNSISDEADGGSQSVWLRTTSLEEVEQSAGFKFDMLVMDIDGAEYEFFKENAGALHRIVQVLVEMHPEVLGLQKCKEVEGILARAGLTRIDSMLTVEFWATPAG